MTIDEAIKLLSGYVYEEKPCPVGLFDEATKLGIEALKRIKYLQGIALYRTDTILPGETEE